MNRLSGLELVVKAIFLKTIVQRYIVHLVQNFIK
ncbi:hypothetical protein ML437_00185 [Staphylococcus roterodami]|nr:hypothetical protein ML437_00185 [Staphylococcus roterodami]